MTTAKTPKPRAAKAKAAPLTEAEQLAADEAALEARRRKIAAEAVVIDEDGETVAVTDETAVALVDEWPYQTVEYANETWEVRKPTSQALAGFSLATGKYVPAQVQQNMVGLFLVNHMSEAAYERVYVRLMDPDDPDFTPDSLGEIMTLVATLPDEAEPDEAVA